MQSVYTHSVCIFLHICMKYCVTLLIVYLHSLPSLYHKMHVFYLCAHIHCSKLFKKIWNWYIRVCVWGEKQNMHPTGFLIWVRLITWEINYLVSHYKRWKLVENIQNILLKSIILRPTILKLIKVAWFVYDYIWSEWQDWN